MTSWKKSLFEVNVAKQAANTQSDTVHTVQMKYEIRGCYSTLRLVKDL